MRRKYGRIKDGKAGIYSSSEGTSDNPETDASGEEDEPTTKLLRTSRQRFVYSCSGFTLTHYRSSWTRGGQTVRRLVGLDVHDHSKRIHLPSVTQ